MGAVGAVVFNLCEWCMQRANKRWALPELLQSRFDSLWANTSVKVSAGWLHPSHSYAPWCTHTTPCIVRSLQELACACMALSMSSNYLFQRFQPFLLLASSCSTG